MIPLLPLSLGVVLAAAVAGVGWGAGALTPGGAVAATVVGGLTFGLGGWIAAVLMVFFFFSSSLLSSLGRRRKELLAQEVAKGSRRDARQVAANGALTASSAALLGITGDAIWLAGVVGALAAVTADTWATELGVLARTTPRQLTSWQPAQPGTSGAVTFEGTAASVVGAGALGGAAAALSGQGAWILIASAAGLVGSLFDSLLGDRWQAHFYCPACERRTEKHPVHGCGQATALAGGWAWLDNDAVNFLASAAGWTAAVGLFLWLRPLT